ncbi:MAG: CPBP family intramembrane glutamic endopeptidase [Spirochaetota bacterium]
MSERSLRESVRFFLITLAATWFVWIGLYRLGILGEEAARIVGTWMPTTVAVILSLVERGRSGARALLERLLRWRVHPGWYLFALAAPVPVVVAAVAAHRRLGGTAISENDPAQWHLIFPAFALIFFTSVLGEEVGWRGYALPRLRDRFGPLRASLVVGVVWGVWHLPLWWMGGNFHAQIPFGLFVLQDVALAIVLTWLFNRTGGSVLLVALLHAASNLAIGLAPLLPSATGGSTRPLWIAVGLLCAGAAVIAAHWVRAGDRPIVVD